MSDEASSEISTIESAAAVATIRHEVSFRRHIAPVLLKHCAACHSERNAQSEYSLFSFALLMTAGATGADPVVAGSADESYLFELVNSDDSELWMPHQKPRLAKDEIQLLYQWIEEGAAFDGNDPTMPLWQLVPPARYPPPRDQFASVPVTAVAFSPEGQYLAISRAHEILIIDPVTGQPVRRIHNVAERTYGLVFHPTSSSLLVAASGNPGQLGEVRSYDVASGEMIREIARVQDVALGVAFDASGSRLACCGADGAIRLFNFDTGKEILAAQHHSDWVYRVAFSADGKQIISASRDATAKIIDAQTGDLATTYNAHQTPVFDAAFVSGGEQAVSCGQDHKIHIWKTAGTGRASSMSESPQDEKKLAEIAGFGHNVLRLAIRGDSVFAASADSRVQQFHLITHQHQRVFADHHYPVYSLALHEESGRLAAGSHDGHVNFWDADSGELVWSWPRP